MPTVAVGTPAPPRGGRRLRLLVLGFLAPALVVLGGLVVYPIIYSVVRSLYDQPGTSFVGVDNYRDIFTRPETLKAIENNALWLLAPGVVTAIGLVLAVLAERIRWSTAFKVALFMPMAISALSAGVIWRIVYEQDPHLGLANAGIGHVVDVFRPPGAYPGAAPSQPDRLAASGNALVTTQLFRPGAVATLAVVGIDPALVPSRARDARVLEPAPGAVTGVVWRDFRPGGGGTKGVVDPGEIGLPGMMVEALRAGRVVGSAVSSDDGTFTIRAGEGAVSLRLAASNFRPAWGGIAWLGPAVITPAIMVSWIWIWAGFAVVVIGAGLAALPRDVLEAARVDGASEWQVFRRVTVPLLIPVVLVVAVTLVINVLKIFDLVFVIAPGSSQASANVIALELYREGFSAINNQGTASALAVFLLLLVLPAILFNYRRFKAGA